MFKNENVSTHALVPGSAGKKMHLPEIVPLNAVDFEINLRWPSAPSGNQRY